MREARADEPPSLQALRRRPVPLEPHGAFEVALVDDAGSLHNNIYEIREVGTRRKLAMTGEEIQNLPRTIYLPSGAEGEDRFRFAYDEAMRDAQREDLGQLEGDQLIAYMGKRLQGVSTDEINRWLNEHDAPSGG